MTQRAPSGRCIVTGAGGLVGRQVVAELKATWEVHAVTHSRPSGLDGTVQWHHADLGSAPLPASLPSEADAIVYLAQSEYFRDFPARAVDVFNVNTVGVVHCLDYARRAGARSFVLASSGGIYRPGPLPLTEQSEVAIRPELGFYLGAKLCAEVLAEQYATYIAGVVILRFFFVYGPGQRDVMLVPRLVRSVREGQPVTLEGSDGLHLNPTYVTDAAAAICRALSLRGHHKINVGGPEVLSLRELCEVIGKHIERKPAFVAGNQPAVDVVADVGRMTELLGPPEVMVFEGIRRLLVGQVGKPRGQV